MWHNHADMARSSSAVVVGPQGRLVVPAALRRELGIEPGHVLLARSEDGRLILEPRDAVIARLRARFAVVPSDVSLADQLIEERRAEARKEEAELTDGDPDD
jgi:AbrB family looped-hinge helix DNA binding protein